MKQIRRNNVCICYQFLKSENPLAKETIIFIHGIGLNLQTWDDIIPYFLKDFHVLRYDLRGHGNSEAGRQKRNTNLLYQDLVYLVESLQISSYHVVAQGFGGLVGIQFAARYKGNLQSLILIGVPVHYPKKLGEQVIQKRKEKVKGHQTMLVMGKELIEKICFHHTTEKKRMLLNSYDKVRPEVYFDLFNLDNLHTTTEDFQQIDKPILMLSGSEDTIYPPEFNAAALNFNRKAKYLTIPDASFLIQMDEPKITADWIIKFIQKNKDTKDMIMVDDDTYLEDLRTQLYSEIGGLLKRRTERQEKVNELKVDMIKSFNVYINGKQVLEGWGRRKSKQILCYLVIHQFPTRDELCYVFWPETDIENAKNRLRVSLHYLKKCLDKYSKHGSVSLLGTDGEHVFLHGVIESDLLRHIEQIKESQNIVDVEKKIQNFRVILMEETENLLPGLFEDSFLNLRSWIEQEWAGMALYLADEYEKLGDMNKTVFYLGKSMKYSVGDNGYLFQRYQELLNRKK